MKSLNLKESYHEAISYFPNSIQKELISIPESAKSEIQEIGLLIGRPIIFTTAKGLRFGKNFSEYPNTDKIDEASLKECFRMFCDYSVHTHQEEIKQGFISISGGHRVGLMGTAVIQEGQVVGMRKINGLYFRIARRIDGIAEALLKEIYKDGIKSLLIAGSPSSGKTTLLRDIARILSDSPYYYRVTVIDERFEIIGDEKIGISCSSLSGFPKAEGILQALRTLAPQIIICDEIGTKEEISAASSGLNSGVFFITSIHADNFKQLSRKSQYQILKEIGAIDKIAFLSGSSKPGAIREIVNL